MSVALPIALPLDKVSDVAVRDTLLRFERGLPFDESVVLEVLQVVVDLIDEADEVDDEISHDLYELRGLLREKEKERIQAVEQEAEREKERDEARKSLKEKLDELRKNLEADHASDMSSVAEGADELRKRAELAEAALEAMQNNAMRASTFWLARMRRDAAREIVETCATYVEKMADGCLDGDATIALRAAAVGIRRDALQVPTARPEPRSDRSDPEPPAAETEEDVPTRSSKRRRKRP